MKKTQAEVKAAFIKGTRKNPGPITVRRDDLALVVGADKVEDFNIDPDDATGSMILVSGAALWNACGGQPQRDDEPIEFDDEDDLDAATLEPEVEEPADEDE